MNLLIKSYEQIFSPPCTEIVNNEQIREAYPLPFWNNNDE